jgi:hypothetical protein
MVPTSAKFIDKIIYEGFSIIALGATLNATLYWSGGRVFDDKMLLKYLELKYDGLHYILSLYSKKSFLTIASGVTPIGSAERAPDDISW